MFDTINHLLFKKGSEELDSELMASFVPYMVSRYLSFYDKDYAVYANETINQYGSVFKTPEDQFKFYDNIIPKLKRKKIEYVKKPKVDKDEEETPIPEFYSKREMKMLTNRGLLSKS
jgi:hypothetical protein